MRVIVAGSRGISSLKLVGEAIKESGFEVTTLLSGMARGVDRAACAWADVNGVPIERHYANWTRDGEFDPQAGFSRNWRMAGRAEALVAIWDGKSSGTKHMIGAAEKKGLKVFVKLVGV